MKLGFGKKTKKSKYREGDAFDVRLKGTVKAVSPKGDLVLQLEDGTVLYDIPEEFLDLGGQKPSSFADNYSDVIQIG